MKFYKYYILVILLIFPANATYAGEENFYGFRAGINAGKISSSVQTDIRKIGRYPNCCPLFSEGNGGGFDFGFVVDYPMTKSFFSEFRVSFVSFNAELNNEEPVTIIYNDRYEEAFIRHYLEIKSSAVDFDYLLGFRFFKSANIMSGIGLSYRTGLKFDQYEMLKSQNISTFTSGTVRRNEYSGSVSNSKALGINLLLGASYDFVVTKTKDLTITPEIFYQFGMSSHLSDQDITGDLLSFGVSAKYTIDSYLKKFTDLNGSVVYFAYDSLGNPQNSIMVRKNLKVTMKPILNYIFFEPDTYEIPERYELLEESETQKFYEEDLSEKSALETYYHVLNILGRRMTVNPDVGIRLKTGVSVLNKYSDPDEISQKRAESIKLYLVKNWKIEPDRIKIAVNVNKTMDSDIQSSNAIEMEDAAILIEKDRVEIIPDSWDLMAPLFVENEDSELISSGIKFVPDIDFPDGVKSWQMSVIKKGIEIASVEKKGWMPESIEYSFSGAENNVKMIDDELVYIYNVHPNKNYNSFSRVDTVKIPVEYSEKKTDRYFLLFPDYESLNLNQLNDRIAELIKLSIKPGDKIVVNSYTDKTGFEETNNLRAEARARILIDKIGARNAEVNSYGETKQLYDNKYPEGRIYSRTVEILINP